MMFSKEIGTTSYTDWIYNTQIHVYLLNKKPFSKAKLDVGSVNDEINCIVCPKYC